jgi:hypothetical protein
MTSWQSVGKADHSQIWPGGLRVTEVQDKSPASSRNDIGGAALRTAITYLKAGWSWIERKRTSQLSSRRLRVAETISLGEKRSVSIIQVDGAQFLIGTSASSVQLLAVLDKQQDETRVS